MDKGWKGQGHRCLSPPSGDNHPGLIIPNPKLKLMDQIRELLGHEDVMGQGGCGMKSPLDNL